jgi:hypothetical protein
VAAGLGGTYGGDMTGGGRRFVPRAASALGLATAVAVLAIVVHATGWHGDAPHRPRAVLPAAAVAPISPALPSRLPDLDGAPVLPAAQPSLVGRLSLDTRPVVAPLEPQARRGYAERGPPPVTSTS